MHVFVAEPNEIHDEAITMLTDHGHTVTTTADHAAEVLFIRTYTQATKTYLSSFPKLRYILRAGVGLDNIDTDECKRRGITVINAPASNANAVAEYVIGVMIMAMRNIPAQSDELRRGGWRSKALIGREIKGRTVGIVGCGAIGKLIALKLQNFSVKTILGYDPYLDAETLSAHHIEKVELDELIAKSDIVTLHLPLTPETKNLVARDRLASMKPGSILINSSRGGIVHEGDLIAALKTGPIAAAALDVFESEPEINQRLLELPNLIATPHIAGYTGEADVAMAVMAVTRFLEMVQS